MIVGCELEAYVHCGEQLVPSGTWHTRKTVQTMGGPLFVAGKSKKCDFVGCSHYGHHYHASGVLRISLPYSTYGLDVLAFIGWQHEHEQEVEIQEMLNQGGIEVCERHVGRLYRQFLALLGGMNERVKRRLDETAEKHGGVMWGIDALQPEGHGTLLYVLYKVLSGTPVAAAQRDAVLMKIEAQVRVATRDAVNRKSRKPLYWGGLKGHEQLEAIAKYWERCRVTSQRQAIYCG